MNTDDVTQALHGLSCSDLSDAMDRLGIACQCAGIKPLSSDFALVGQAWPIRYGPVGTDPGTVGDYIDDLGDGQVVVLDNQGREDTTVWGDLLTTVAHQRRVAGTVIDGVCRDVDRSVALGYPLFARGNWMRTGKDRVQVETVGQPVTIGGIRVEAGDWLRGDGDGIVVAPQGRIEEILDTAVAIHAAEDRIRASVQAGMSLRQARAENGYHQLQTRVAQ